MVVHIGTNGTFSAEQFDEMMRILADVRKVVFVNVKAPRPWEESNNNMLANGVRRYPNAVLRSIGTPPAPTDLSSSWTTGSTSNPKASESTPT